jgi:carbamoyl-phosphate synthase large subunit
MPKRTDIDSILIIGAGPIVIGQACEFDYSGAQACKALREEGFRVILVNSNPATIMTDPEMADAIYIEPIHWSAVESIIAKERPDALLPTMGGQTALNCALDLARHGILEKYNVEMIAASREAIDMAEDRDLFRQAMTEIGLESPTADIAHSLEEALEKQQAIGFPTIIRPSFTMGGTGGGIAYNREEFVRIVKHGLEMSPTTEVLLEESVIGWKEFEMEVVRDTGRVLIIEMNPRVSRSSALASKATGFPIAKVAAKLAVGYTLDELKNEITGGLTPASFEPAIDYVVTKIPRFTFEKFPGTNDRLTTQMKSVGEVMAIGRNFQESLQKALRGLETGINGLDEICGPIASDPERDHLRQELRIPGSNRILYVADAMRHGYSFEDVAFVTGIDPWFLIQIADLVNVENEIREKGLPGLNAGMMRAIKRKGFSDARIAALVGVKEQAVRKRRLEMDVRPVYKRVDTCAAEFATTTAYMYSTYEEECEADPTDNPKIMILGGGPNRVGQGIEFDYCCVHAALALKESGYETIMVNCNPETVSTDYDTSDRLYFESLTFEDVMEIIDKEQPRGVIVQYGGQTPLKLARALEAAGAPIIGTSPDSIDLAEDRERFQRLVEKLELKQPPNRTATSKEQALQLGVEVGYPLVVRPSYVLGGRAMEVVHSDEDLGAYMDAAIGVSNDSPVLLDRFLDLATEVDVDCICDGERVLIGGIMEHIEQAGVHSGDSGCSLPPFSLDNDVQKELEKQVIRLAKGLKVVGLMNTQFAIQGDVVYLLEVNPRASRTAPFVSKATGVPLAKIAAKVMVGETLAKQGIVNQRVPDYFSVKEAVFPFIKFPGADPILGPEMKSTGEVMGVGRTFGEAYAKAQLASGVVLPRQGAALLSVRERDKDGAIELARILSEMGFDLVATHGTAKALAKAGVSCQRANKVREGRPHIVDMIKNGEIDLIVNTTEGKQAITESESIRAEAVRRGVTYYTTLGAAIATCRAIEHLDDHTVNRLQDLHNEVVA